MSASSAAMGLTNIYEFLREVRGMDEPAWLAERIAAEDPNAVITELALAAKSEICEKALDMFVSAYGAEAGNLALKVLSVGGVYIGGGIAPRILEKLKDGTFMKAFTDKGRLSQLLINMPVRIILESRAALLGAAAYAEARAADSAASRPAPPRSKSNRLRSVASLPEAATKDRAFQPRGVEPDPKIGTCGTRFV
jgi:glucokinase